MAPRRLLVRSLLATACLAGAATAQVFGPTGFETRANTHTSGPQGGASVGFTLSESFIVVWSGDGPTGEEESEIWGQRYASNGSPLAGQFRVNTYTTGSQYEAQIAVSDTGRFVVVWLSDFEDGDGQGIFGQRFTIAGAPDGSAFRVNTTTVMGQLYHAVAQSGALDFVVVWAATDATGSLGVFGQRFLSTGAPAGPQFRVNTVTTPGNASHPSVSRAVGGGFVVTWEADQVHGPGTFAIQGRRFGAAGAPAGIEFDVTAGTTQFQHPSVGVGSGGTFVVAWEELNGDFVTGYVDVFARRYDATATALGSVFRVNTYTSGNQNYVQVAANPYAVGFAVVWTSPQAGSGLDVVARRFASTGVPTGAEFRVNTYTSTEQVTSGVSMATTRDFVVAWSSYGFQVPTQDGSVSGAFLQRFCQSLAGDVDANGGIGVSDVLFLINNLFAGGPPPFPGTGDVNGDGLTNVSDILYLINYLFASGQPPVCTIEIA